MREIKAPHRYRLNKTSIFLAGSIEMGVAHDWQQEVCEALADEDVIILNPRREHWDTSWTQRITNKRFHDQVEWELRALERADIIIFNFLVNTKSPISLLELGIDKDKDILVCCEPGFWRRGNIEVVCEHYNLPLFENMAKLLAQLRRKIKTRAIDT